MSCLLLLLFFGALCRYLNARYARRRKRGDKEIISISGIDGKEEKDAGFLVAFWKITANNPLLNAT